MDYKDTNLYRYGEEIDELLELYKPSSQERYRRTYETFCAFLDTAGIDLLSRVAQRDGVSTYLANLSVRKQGEAVPAERRSHLRTLYRYLQQRGLLVMDQRMIQRPGMGRPWRGEKHGEADQAP